MKRLKPAHETGRTPRRRAGYSLSESLLAVLIVALLSMGIAAGVAFGVRQYRHATARSEQRILCSTLASVIRNELAITRSVWTDGDRLDGFFSENYGSESGQKRCFYAYHTVNGVLTRASDGYGQLYVAGTGTYADPIPLLPSAAYSSYQMQAKVEVDYLKASGVFRVRLKVRTPDGAQEVETSFNVLPLNKLQIDPLLAG